MDIEIKSVNITIGEMELELTMEEARKLQEALNKLLGNQVIYNTSPWYVYPNTIDINGNYKVPEYTITYTNGTAHIGG